MTTRVSIKLQANFGRGKQSSEEQGYQDPKGPRRERLRASLHSHRDVINPAPVLSAAFVSRTRGVFGRRSAADECTQDKNPEATRTRRIDT